MDNLTLPISQLVELVRSRKVTAVSLVQASLDRIAATTEYHSVLEINEQALPAAKLIDAAIESGDPVGPLAGIPYIAKDNFLTLSTHTTAASRILEPFTAPYSAVAIKRLEAAGAIMVAKANLDAFAHGSSTENSDFGPTKNPHNPAYVPGGSSGGSAAAVALGQATFALGTDTGGSIRLPASYCGVVGLKPTYGLVPRTGVIAMASSTDVIGPLTRRVEDSAIILDVLAGIDASDSTSIERDQHGYLGTLASSLAGKKIGLIKQYLGAGTAPEIRSDVDMLVAHLQAEGATVDTIELPATQLALSAYYILVPAEISSNLARYDGVRYGYRAPSATDLESSYRTSRDEGFGCEAKRRIMIGTYVLSSGYYDAYYKQAQKVRTRLIEQFEQAFSTYDVLIGPTAPTPAFKLGANTHDPLAMYQNDVCTVAVNLVGCPAISVPLGQVEALPFGIQLITPQCSERQLFGLAAAFEELITRQVAV